MNAPAALYWYHQHPSTADYRNSSSNSTGPWTSSIDPTGKPGVFGLVKYVPEVTEGVTEYERGLKDSAVLWRKELAAEREKVAQLLAALEAAKPPLELYQAYGWSDRAGVIGKVDAAIAHAKATP